LSGGSGQIEHEFRAILTERPYDDPSRYFPSLFKYLIRVASSLADNQSAT
jgi:hypothetical protein